MVADLRARGVVPVSKPRCRHPKDFRVGAMIVVEHNVVGLLSHTAWCSKCGAFRCKTVKGWRWVSPGVRLHRTVKDKKSIRTVLP